MNTILVYNNSQTDQMEKICTILKHEIETYIPQASAKLYHSNPVWFIDDNPIVGYDVAGDRVNLLFWSGQSFQAEGLKATGKFEAAGTFFNSEGSVNKQQLRQWLEESVAVQWNYRDLRKNNGELLRI
jgi:hypothetical protein